MERDARVIIQKTIEDIMPGVAVKKMLHKLALSGKIYVAAIGKAAWTMAEAAHEILNEKLAEGIIVTKYNHSFGKIDKFTIIEAGHPVPDENSVNGARNVIDMLKRADRDAVILFLISGGGSSLFEIPAKGMSLEKMCNITQRLLASGASITEMNVIRKKLSEVKGGKIMKYIDGRKAYAVIMSDIVGEHEDMIASGLTYPDYSSGTEAVNIVNKYGISSEPGLIDIIMSQKACLECAVENHIIGSVRQLCMSAATHAMEQGYLPHIITTSMESEAVDAGKWLAEFADRSWERPYAVIAGGETVVKVKGKGKGGRNQELALGAALSLQKKGNVILFSFGSDGTDGPTDAAGGIVDGLTIQKIREKGLNASMLLDDNDSYRALKAADALIITGPTGTNVNDVSVLLCR